MKKLSQSFFYFTKAEQRGIFVILIISLLLLIVPGFIKSLNSDSKLYLELEQKTDTLLNNKESIKTKYESAQSNIRNTKSLLTKIDINSASRTQLQQIGLSKHTSNTIIKYREKGGMFKDFESIKKIYNITDHEVASLTKTLVFEADSSSKTKLTIHPFDPNTVTKEELLSMGIRLRLAQTMINFRSKGFKFKNKEDITKIYGITEAEKKVLLSNIKFDTTNLADQSTKSIHDSKSFKNLVEINTASFEELDGLRGIGTVWANKIMKFRDALGGFYSKDQIKEIRGIDDSLAQLVIRQISCNSNIKKLNINKASYGELSKHPYISGKQAGVIINYIKQHGKLNNMKDVEKLLAFIPIEYKKLEPYLEFNEVSN